MNWLALVRAIPPALEVARSVVRYAGAHHAMTHVEALKAADEAHLKLALALSSTGSSRRVP